MRPPAKEKLQERIIRSLRSQGFSVRKGKLVGFADNNKDALRTLHEKAVSHQRSEARAKLGHLEDQLLNWVANGDEVDPLKIDPKLVLVRRGSVEELVFRYARLHWSIPVSSGYGRRLRFLVIDKANGKLIGIIGLADPVINLGARDRHIGWTAKQKSKRLRHVLDAFALGAVPPYSMLLCGKLVAMLAASDEVRRAFRKQYRNTKARISRSRFDGRLAMITTASALGRSSVYNRISLAGGRRLFKSVGMSQGSGEFHFSNGIYTQIAAYARLYCSPTERSLLWGTGFRNRRELIKKCLQKIGLSADWLYHGVERELFVVPLAINAEAFLCGKRKRLRHIKLPAATLVERFKTRWLVPRLQTNLAYRSWTREQWRLWSKPPR